jgi:hypothetical protein
MHHYLHINIPTTLGGMQTVPAELSINDSSKMTLIAENPRNPDEFYEVEIVQEPDGTLKAKEDGVVAVTRVQVEARSGGHE